MRRCYVDLPDGAQLHLRTAGAAGDAPRGAAATIVLLHQSPSSSAMWDAVLPVFARRGYRAVALDLPGYGLSDSPAVEPDLTYYAGRVGQALDALGLTQVSVLGHHTGGSVGLQLAVDRPDLVARLAIWGVGLLDEDFARRLAEEDPPEYDADGTEIVRFWRTVRALARPEQRDTFALRFLVEMLQSGAGRPYGHRAVGRADHRALLRRLSQPLLGLAGPHEMLLEETRRAVALVPGARLVELPGAGMDVADSHPEELVSAVDRFVRASAHPTPA